jgi:hypothetical protein
MSAPKKAAPPPIRRVEVVEQRIEARELGRGRVRLIVTPVVTLIELPAGLARPTSRAEAAQGRTDRRPAPP